MTFVFHAIPIGGRPPLQQQMVITTRWGDNLHQRDSVLNNWNTLHVHFPFPVTSLGISVLDRGQLLPYEVAL